MESGLSKLAVVENETTATLFLVSWDITSIKFFAAAFVGGNLLVGAMLPDLSIIMTVSVGAFPHVLGAAVGVTSAALPRESCLCWLLNSMMGMTRIP